MSYVYIFLTITLTVYGQLVIKWQVNQAGNLPDNFADKIFFLFHLLMSGWVLSGFLAAFLASLAWMAAMTKLDLSHAYPFMSLAFVLVLVFSALFFHEPLTRQKILGTGLVVLGIVVVSQG